MKLLATLALTSALIFALTPALTLGQSPAHWRPATYRGLTIGKSKRTAMLRILGKPKWSQGPKGDEDEDKESASEVWYHYDQTNGIPGALNILAENGTIKRIDLFPKRLSKREAIAELGSGYLTTRYDIDPCPGSEDDETLYESPNGPISAVEYRARGIAVFVGYNDFVTKISYVNQAIGAARARCK
jgi:hypothetical protein